MIMVGYPKFLTSSNISIGSDIQYQSSSTSVDSVQHGYARYVQV